MSPRYWTEKIPPIVIAPSMLNSDFARLADQVKVLEAAGVDSLHIDVADAHFAPNIMLGPRFLKVLHGLTTLPINCHLMMTDPAEYAPRFIEAGARLVWFHIEAVEDPHEVIKVIRDAGAKPAVALKPRTPASTLASCIDELDAIMAMTVEPGFSGQSFMEEGCYKIPEIRDMAPEIDIYVDGGVNAETAPIVVRYGANAIVAASAIFDQENIVQNVGTLRAAAESARKG